MRQWQSAFCRSIFRNWVEHFLSIYIFISNLYFGNVFMAIPHKNKKVNRQFYFLAKVTRYKMGVPNVWNMTLFGCTFACTSGAFHFASIRIAGRKQKKKSCTTLRKTKNAKEKNANKKVYVFTMCEKYCYKQMLSAMQKVLFRPNCPSILNSEMFTEPNATMHQSSALTTQQHFHSNDI